jgi:hypothetical protein
MFFLMWGGCLEGAGMFSKVLDFVCVFLTWWMVLSLCEWVCLEGAGMFSKVLDLVCVFLTWWLVVSLCVWVVYMGCALAFVDRGKYLYKLGPDDGLVLLGGSTRSSDREQSAWVNESPGPCGEVAEMKSCTQTLAAFKKLQSGNLN